MIGLTFRRRRVVTVPAILVCPLCGGGEGPVLRTRRSKAHVLRCHLCGDRRFVEHEVAVAPAKGQNRGGAS